MNRRIKELLAILLNAPGRYYSYRELADQLGVGTRSVRNYIQTIQDFISQQGNKVYLNMSDKGISLTGSTSALKELMDTAVDSEFYLYRLDPTERSYMTLLTLLLNQDYCTISQLSEKFKVSRGTVLKDIDQVKRIINDLNINFDTYINKGYLLEITESERRFFIIQLLRSYSVFGNTSKSQISLHRRYFLETTQLQSEIPIISKILLEAEQAFDFSVSDACFEHMIDAVSVVFSRLKQGHLLSQSSSTFESPKNPSAKKIADFLLNHLSSSTGIPYNEHEIDVLSSVIYENRFYKDCSLDDLRDIQIHIAVFKFMRLVAQEIQIPIDLNETMVTQLERHLKDIAKAHFSGVVFHNEYTESMQLEYHTYYTVIRQHLHLLEESIGYTYTEDDITFILFYVIAAAEQYFQDTRKTNVIVVCHSGVGTANFLAEQLRSYFNIQIVSVTSVHKLSHILQIHDVDLIVSTIPLTMEDTQWVKVSPFLSDQDILMLQKVFIDLKKKHRNLGYSSLHQNLIVSSLSILKEENILLDVDANNWQDAITMAAKPLLKEQAIQEVYVQRMIESVKQNGTYFVYCPHVALAHAGPQDGILHFGFSLIRLKKPVRFGHDLHDPVSYVLCLASSERDTRLKEVLWVMNLLSNPDELKTIDCFTNHIQLFNYMKQKIAPTSSVIGCSIVNSIVIRIVEHLLEMNVEPPIFHSANVDGGDEFNKLLFERYKDQIHYM